MLGKKGTIQIKIMINVTKGWDISALSFHKLLQVLYEKDVLNEWGR